MAGLPEVFLTLCHRLVDSVLMQAAERFSQTLSQVASNANLDRIGRQRGLHRYVNSNPSQRQVVSPITMAATMEAILGAVYLDNNLEKVWEVMQTLGLVPLASQDAGESIDDQAHGA